MWDERTGARKPFGPKLNTPDCHGNTYVQYVLPHHHAGITIFVKCNVQIQVVLLVLRRHKSLVWPEMTSYISLLGLNMLIRIPITF